MRITKAFAHTWAARYFHAWKTNDRALVESLFSPDAVYYYGPFRPPARGREEIVTRWLMGENQNINHEFELIAVAGDGAVIHWNVRSAEVTIDGILVIRFDKDGLCYEHREWYVEAPPNR